MKTIVCVPYFGHKDLAHDDCMRALRRTTDVVEVRDVPWIDQARAILATKALGLGADVVVFIDHDMIFDADSVKHLAEMAAARNAVVAAPYGRKDIGQPIVGGFAPGIEQVTFFQGGGLYPAALVGLGFTAIPSSIFDLMSGYPEVAVAGGEKVRPYFLPAVTQTHYLGEDAAFCMRVLEHGAKLFIDTTVRVLHQGRYAYAVDDATTARRLAPSIQVSLKPAPNNQ